MKKGLIVLAVLVGFGGLGWLIFKKVNPSAAQLTGDVLIDRAILIANKIHASMNRIGTDWIQLKTAFQDIDNQLEFTRVYNAFGIRPYENWFHGLPSFMYPQLNMSQWIQEETSDAERLELNQIMSAKGITSTL